MRYPRCNLHTHTVFCDGKNTPEEMVQAALAARMEQLGFSGHSYTPFDGSCCMSPDRTEAYRAELARLREVYRGRLRILCGIEQDFYSPQPALHYDYIIGSVHYLWRDGVYCPVDESRERLQRAVREQFAGNIYRFLACYYETLAQVKYKTGCDIVGHFDLVEKFNEGECLFSGADYRYRRPMLDALDQLLEQDVIFEINTGAMSRGYRSTPYPSAYILRRIAEKRGRVMLNSDAHSKDALMWRFDEAAQYAHSCGVGGLTVPDDAHGWRVVPLGREA